ncbi:hypothetical protein RHMOL_Rhmol13G0239500 [Rhododendron molle]|uniref:Uncharacterized protein n=1 Tax=Rhododendron molle TaxID=49168 RepID=A0ACC0LAK9_RHOML|nr:hypothetical protein RHMOL_Rhmol13G0239500 [Rhododendron molle]
MNPGLKRNREGVANSRRNPNTIPQLLGNVAITKEMDNRLLERWGGLEREALLEAEVLATGVWDLHRLFPRIPAVFDICHLFSRILAVCFELFGCSGSVGARYSLYRIRNPQTPHGRFYCLLPIQGQRVIATVARYRHGGQLQYKAYSIFVREYKDVLGLGEYKLISGGFGILLTHN